MQLKLVAFSALVASVVAEPVPAPAISLPPSAAAALLSVLPPSAIAYITASGEGAFSKHIASEFSAGQTPGWFTKLPPKVESLLLGAGSNSTNSTAPSNSSTSTHTHSGAHQHHTTSLTLSTGPGPVSVTSTPPITSSTPAPSTSTGGAAVASAIFGAGMVGAMGLMGVLAL